MFNMLISSLLISFLRLINHLFRKNTKSIMFIPHPNCKFDNYDIFRYESDNTLKLCHDIINNRKFDEFDLYILYYDNKKREKYLSYVNSLNRQGKVNFIYISSSYFRSLSYFKVFFRLKYVFVSDAIYNFSYKTKDQIVTCLGYYTPFKDDSWVLSKIGEKNTEIKRKRINKSFDYQISTSALSSRIVSLDELIHFNRFRLLGFPRNDIFYNPDTKLRQKIEYFFGKKIDFILCYTPTYRDYERTDLYLGRNEHPKVKTMWGNDSPDCEFELDEILEKYNAVIISKLHPWQEKNVLIGKTSSRIISFNLISEQIGASLYSFLSISDGLITDYTSTCFDYMHLNKPIIYYFYDFNKYLQNRGFSYDPIENFCGGKIVYNFTDLLDSVKTVFETGDICKEKRHYVHSIMNKYHDGNSSIRITDLVLNDIKRN